MGSPTSARKLLAQVQLGNALADIYLCPTQPPNGITEVYSLAIANTDTATRTITLRQGVGTLTAANSLLEAVPIPANTTWIFTGSEVGLIFPFGGHFQGLADVAAKVTITLAGAEIL